MNPAYQWQPAPPANMYQVVHDINLGVWNPAPFHYPMPHAPLIPVFAFPPPPNFQDMFNQTQRALDQMHNMIPAPHQQPVPAAPQADIHNQENAADVAQAEAIVARHPVLEERRALQQLRLDMLWRDRQPELRVAEDQEPQQPFRLQVPAEPQANARVAAQQPPVVQRGIVERMHAPVARRQPPPRRRRGHLQALINELAARDARSPEPDDDDDSSSESSESDSSDSDDSDVQVLEAEGADIVNDDEAFARIVQQAAWQQEEEDDDDEDEGEDQADDVDGDFNQLIADADRAIGVMAEARQWIRRLHPMGRGGVVDEAPLFDDGNHEGFVVGVDIEEGAAEEGPEQAQARAQAKAAKTERIQKQRAEDDHPDSAAVVYSRECKICLTPHPRKRVVLVPCGHMMCLACADHQAEGDSKQLDCPNCRGRATYVRCFEGGEEPPKAAQPPESRKRKSEGKEEASSSTKRQTRNRRV